MHYIYALSSFSSIMPPPPLSTLFPYTTLFRSVRPQRHGLERDAVRDPGDLRRPGARHARVTRTRAAKIAGIANRSEEHTSELQSHHDLVCRLLLEKKKKKKNIQLNATLYTIKK